MEHTEYIEVDKTWLAFAKQIGDLRENANTNTQDKSAYKHNGTLPYSSRTASRLAVVGEIAGHFYLGVDPESTVFFVEKTEANYKALKAAADLTAHGRKIEIRNCARTTSPLPIYEKDATADAIVIQVHVEMEQVPGGTGQRPTGRVEFLGWRYGKEYRPSHARRGTDYRKVKYSMSDLKAVLGL